jgi:hypothetical protein
MQLELSSCGVDVEDIKRNVVEFVQKAKGCSDNVGHLAKINLRTLEAKVKLYLPIFEINWLHDIGIL